MNATGTPEIARRLGCTGRGGIAAARYDAEPDAKEGAERGKVAGYDSEAELNVSPDEHVDGGIWGIRR